MTLPKKLDLPMLRGDDDSYTLSLLDKTGGKMNLTNCTIKCTIQEDSRSAQIVQLTWVSDGSTGGTPNGIDVADVTQGVVVIDFPNSATSQMEPYSDYSYDIEVTNSVNKKKTVYIGKILITADITS